MSYSERRLALDDAEAACRGDNSFDRITVTDADLDPKTGTGRVHRSTPAHVNDGGWPMHIELVAPAGATCIKISTTDPVQYSVTSTNPKETARVKAILGIPGSPVAPVFELQRS